MGRYYMDDRWYIGYNHLVEYYKEHGNSLVPQRYICDDGYNLGAFCEGQKGIKRKGRLRADRAALLEKVEFKYSTKRKTLTWDEWYEEAEIYYKEHGNLDVSIRYITPSGNKLGVWVNEQAKFYRDGLLSDERIKKLNAFEMKWYRQEDNWYEKYDSLYDFYLKNNHISVPVGYVDEHGNDIYRWLEYQKRKLRDKSLTKEQIDCLNEIGVKPIGKKNKHGKWDNYYNKLRKLCYEHGSIEVAMMFAGDDSKFRNWMSNQRKKYFDGTLDKDAIVKLNSINFDWATKDTSYLNKDIVDYNEYKKVMLKRMKHILEDLSLEEEKEDYSNEIIKRMWR